MSYKTEQENFWAGEFGKEYIQRNHGEELLASNLNFFVKSLNTVNSIATCIEFGANIGMNLKAIKALFPKIDQYAVEINNEAVNSLNSFLKQENVFHESIIDFIPEQTWELVLIKGVLIHINPNELEHVYEKLVNSTSKYLLVAEYYNPTPVVIPYRGHIDRLFKRDFAGEILQKYSNMKLVDYGFVSKHDPKYPQDDITWFLLQKET